MHHIPSSRTRNRVVVALTVCQAAVLLSQMSVECLGLELFQATRDETVESIPAPTNVPASPPECESAPADQPLWKLNTDIRPRTHDGQIITADRLPVNCAGLKPPEQRMMNVELSCNSCYPGYCDILSLARFCHQPLYFNDDCLESCGCESCCCQPARSAMCFYGRALLLPVTACWQCPCSCVRSGGCCQ